MIKAAWTEIPRDFVVDKENLNESELNVRFSYAQGRRIFDKNIPEVRKIGDGSGGMRELKVQAELPPVENDREDFLLRHQNLRSCVIDMWYPRIGHIWIEGFHRVTQDKHKGKVNSVEDFLVMYRQSAPDCKEMRRLVDTVQHRMITKQQMMQCEQSIMHKMLLKYLDVLANGKSCLTNRKHGSILIIGNRVKQSKWCAQIRTVTFVTRGEAIYHRGKSFDKEGKLRNVQKGVVEVFKTTHEEWGYDGWMGVSAGHFTQLKKQKESQDLAAKSCLPLMQWLDQKIKEGTTKNTDELLKEYRATTCTDSKPAVISVREGDSVLSPITEPGPVSCTVPLLHLHTVAHLT